MMNTVSLIDTEILDESAQIALEEATLTAQSLLKAIASDKDFATKLTLAFGDSFDAENLEDLRQQWQAGDFDSLPTIEIRAAAEINGANGAFSADTNTIYLSQEYMAQNAADEQEIADVLLEEIGHSVDSHINVLDAPGDEGAIFSALTQGKQLDQSTLQGLKIDNDSIVLALDGNVIHIEQDSTDIKRPILIVPGIAGTFAKDFNTNWYFNRGVKPEELEIDPIAGVYYDLIKTLKNVGYVEGENLFVANYDWRLPTGPLDGQLDGNIDGLSVANLTDNTYEYGVDYFGYWLNQAKAKGASEVDIIAHSTGGLVTRTYIQSDAYEQAGEQAGLPKINNFFMIGVPNRGASQAWNPLRDNWIRKEDLSFVGATAPDRFVLSKIINKAYQHILDGGSISGSPSSISLETINNPVTNKPDPVKFINQYVPSLNNLLATYDFLEIVDEFPL